MHSRLNVVLELALGHFKLVSAEDQEWIMGSEMSMTKAWQTKTFADLEADSLRLVRKVKRTRISFLIQDIEVTLQHSKVALFHARGELAQHA